jgi:hypothetical protein
VTDTPSTEDIEPRDFAVILYALNKGRTHEQLSEALRGLTKAVTTTRKAGKLQLVLAVKPQPGVEGAVLVTADVRASTPKFDQPASIFYTTDDGDLVRNDPTQPSLFREITTGKEATK